MSTESPHPPVIERRSLARRFIAPAVFVAALFVVTILRDRPPSDASPELWSFTGPTMGTSFTVKVVAPELDGSAQRSISDAIAATLEEIDSAMSTWREDSEIAAFNRSGTAPFHASEAFLEVVDEALDVARRSDGALDVTVAPLVTAWGFSREGRGETPTPEQLATITATTGWQHLQVDRTAGTLRKSIPELEIDLSAIAKGYAVDRVTAALQQLGYADLMVEIGGEVRTAGRTAEGRPWRIGIEVPDRLDRSARRALELDHRAMATSGDYRNFYELDGKRISHTIDPRSGRPVSHDLASVSVVAASCMSADAWATALNVLGPEFGLQLAESEGIAALFIVRRNGGFREVPSRAFTLLDASYGVGTKP